MLPTPINLPKWLEENSHLLKPPINNCCVYDGDVTVMIVGGPNSRTDYHINQTPEWFYQYRGAMTLKVITTQDDDDHEPKPADIIIREGSMLLLPAGVPHNPIRFPNTVGIVIEQRRPPGVLDRLRWYCAAPSCRERGRLVVVHESAFRCEDLGSQVREAVEAFAADVEARRCGECGVLADAVPAPGSIPDPNLEG